VNLIARMRRALLRATDVLPERLVTNWASDVATGPLAPAPRSESACHPRSGCDCGSDRVAMCGAAGCVPAMTPAPQVLTRNEAARGRQSGGEGTC
jgi:hypothetical protein